jgi:hypothetical protein
MTSIIKEIFLESRECRTKGWYLRKERKERERQEKKGQKEHRTDAEIFRMEQGQLVGDKARNLFPEGILVTGAFREACKKTKQLLAKRSTRALFEASFEVDGYRAKADILIRVMGGWKLLEVKSTRHPIKRKKKREELVDDLSYTAMVLSHARVRIVTSGLLLISSDFRKPMDEHQLFVEVDKTDAVKARVKDFKKVTTIEADTRGRRPKPEVISACDRCEFFATECLGKGLENPVTQIPNISRRLSKLPTLEIHELPADLRFTDRQSIVVNAVREGSPFVAPTLKAALRTVKWPVYYLDFETTSAALPFYEDVAPHEQVVTQYSIHRVRRRGDDATHVEYLADKNRDCRREIAESLIDHLGTTGNIIVYYQPFEEGRLKDLAEQFDDLVTPLKALIDRLVDLKDIVEDGYYHPDFNGSYSIKDVLPVVVPDLTYEGMEIGDGDAAIVTFARMALGEFSEREEARVRTALKDYCKLDTLAMVRLHERLEEIARDAAG